MEDVKDILLFKDGPSNMKRSLVWGGIGLAVGFFFLK
jgi:hypothetical protein